MFSCSITAPTNDKKVQELKQRIGEDGSLSRLHKKNYAILGTIAIITALGLQIQDNNFTSWPTSRMLIPSTSA